MTYPVPQRSCRVGWPAEKLNPDGSIEGVRIWLEATERPSIAIQMRSGPVFSASLAALGFYLSDRDADSKHWGLQVLLFAEEYFFGEWRQRLGSGERYELPPDPKWLRSASPWQSAWEACLLWGSVLSRWPTLEHLATYLAEDICVDVEQSEANRAWLLVLAGLLRGRPWDEMGHLVTAVQESRAKREKLLLAFLDAILHAPDSEVALAATAYFNHYKSTEWKRPFLTKKIMVDGSFLVHLAEHRGRCIPVPLTLVDHIVRLETASTPVR